MNRPVGRVVAIAAVSLATILVLLGIGVAALFNPPLVAFEQARADSAGWTGYRADELRAATDGILGQLYFGPGDFAITVRGEQVLDPRERAHMHDVRGVFSGFFALVVLSAVFLALVGRRMRGAAWFWQAVRTGTIVLAVGVALLGVVSLVAFDALFEVFHEIFFAGGTYLFDPRTERLVQLFPDQFWSETSIILGVILLGLAGVVYAIAGRQARHVAEAVAGRPGRPLEAAL